MIFILAIYVWLMLAFGVFFYFAGADAYEPKWKRWALAVGCAVLWPLVMIFYAISCVIEWRWPTRMH